MIILIYLIVISDRWMVLHVQSCACAVTATHLVMGSVQKICRESKAKNSHGDHKEIDHGLANMQKTACQYHPTFLKYRISC